MEEKQRILKAIEEDPMFRHALMGLLGFREILDRITRIEERITRIEERQQKLEERMVELEERQQKLEERQQRLEERMLKLEERMIKLEERQQMLEERQQKLEERLLKVEEELAELRRSHNMLIKKMINLEKLVTTIAHRFGVITETAFREALSDILARYFGATASRLDVFDEEGIVFGYPSMVNIDVVVKDDVHIVVEVKSRVDGWDVLKVVRLARLYEKKTGVKPRMAIVAGYATKKAIEVAKKFGVDIYTYLEDEQALS